MDDTIEMNTRVLDAFIKSLKGEIPSVVVGILGSKDARTGKGANSNSLVGAKHEFGSPQDGIPMRSFLRIPIADNLETYIEKSDAFDRDTMTQVIQTCTLIPWLKKIGAIGEHIVADGFASGGFGKWAPWKPGYTNNANMILVDTQQLRNSITSEVR